MGRRASSSAVLHVSVSVGYMNDCVSELIELAVHGHGRLNAVNGRRCSCVGRARGGNTEVRTRGPLSPPFAGLILHLLLKVERSVARSTLRRVKRTRIGSHSVEDSLGPWLGLSQHVTTSHVDHHRDTLALTPSRASPAHRRRRRRRWSAARRERGADRRRAARSQRRGR